MHKSVGVQDFQIFSDRNLGGVEFPGHVRDQHTAVPLESFDDGTPALFVKHVSSLNRGL
jgi:hypothetical protein